MQGQTARTTVLELGASLELLWSLEFGIWSFLLGLTASQKLRYAPTLLTPSCRIANRTIKLLEIMFMPTVAEQLRTSREAQGLTVYQVAEITKIRTDHVRALEEGNYETFAAPVYVRGFVRTYATLLKLDVPGMMSLLEGELSQTEKFQELSPLFDKPRGFLDVVVLQLAKVDWRVALPSLGVALALLMAILGYRAWRAHRSKDPLSTLGPGIYQPAEKQSGDTLPLPPSAQPKR